MYYKESIAVNQKKNEIVGLQTVYWKIQLEEKQKMQRNEESLGELWYTTKKSNICVTGVQVRLKNIK